MQPNVKSLKIAAAVNDVNKKLVIGEVVKQCKFLLNILRTVEGYL